MSTLPPADHRRNSIRTPRPHDPLTCGLDPDLDCDQCGALREARDRTERRHAAYRDRRRRRKAALGRLARAAGVSPAELRSALLSLLARPLGELLAELKGGAQ